MFNRICLNSVPWLQQVYFRRFVSAGRLFTAGGGEGGSASLPELKKRGEGGGGDYRNRGGRGIIGILQSLKGRSGKF